MKDDTSLHEPESFQLEDVFIPAHLPDKTYVKREDVGTRFEKHLRSRGRPICIVGPHRSGKTTLALTEVQRKYARHIHVVCKKSSTFDQLLRDAFDALDPYYAQETSEKALRSPSGVAFTIPGLNAHLGSKGRESVSKQQRVLAPQMTPRALAGYSAAADAPWIIDDVHKLALEELSKVAEAMREWQTLVLERGIAKMIVIGTEQFTTSIPMNLIDAAPDLKQRLVDITITFMPAEELKEIISAGAKALNVDFSEVADQIIQYSFGFPGVCQDLCFHICHAARVDMTAEDTVQLSQAHLNEALVSYMKDCATSIKATYDQLYANPPAGGLPTAYTKVVLDTVAVGALEGADLDKVVDSVKLSLNINPTQTRAGLEYLTDDDRGVLRVDVEANRIHFKEPLYYVHYRHGIGAVLKEATKQVLLKKFLEAIRQQ